MLDYLRTSKLRLPNPETQPGLYSAVLDEFDYFCIPMPNSQPENLNDSEIPWDRLSSEAIVSDSCSVECIKVVGDILLW